jgi:hypothetical protein
MCTFCVHIQLRNYEPDDNEASSEAGRSPTLGGNRCEGDGAWSWTGNVGRRFISAGQGYGYHDHQTGSLGGKGRAGEAERERRGK